MVRYLYSKMPTENPISDEDQAQEEIPTSKYDETKAELGLEDDDIRALNAMQSTVQIAVHRAIGSKEEKQRAFLIKELKKRDRETIKAAKRELAATKRQLEREINEPEPDWWDEDTGNTERARKRRERTRKRELRSLSRRHKEVKDICQKDPEKWDIVLKFCRQRTQQSDKGSADYEFMHLSRFFQELYQELTWQRTHIEKEFKDDPDSIYPIIHSEIYLRRAVDICKGNEDKFRTFLDVAKHNHYGAMYLSDEAYKAYGDNEEMFQVFARLAKQEGGAEMTRELAAARSAYGDDMVRFQTFAELVQLPGGGELVEELTAAKEAYQGRPKVFEKFADILRNSSGGRNFDARHLVRDLAHARDAYGDSEHRFQVFADLSEVENGERRVANLAGVRDAYGEDDSAFDIYAEIAAGKSYDGNAVTTFKDAQPVYENNQRRQDLIAELAKKGGTNEIDAMILGLEIYGDDEEKFDMILDLASQTQGGTLVDLLVKNKDIYEGKDERLKICVEILKGSNEKTRFNCLVRAKVIYGDDDEKFDEIVEAIRYKSHGVENVDSLVELRDIWDGDDQKYGKLAALLSADASKHILTILVFAKEIYREDDGKLDELIAILKEQDRKTLEALVHAKGAYVNDMEKFNVFLRVAQKGGAIAVRALGEAQEAYQDDTEKLEIAVKYFALTSISDTKTLTKYIEIFQKEGHEKAKQYIDKLPDKAKGLVSSRVPTASREMDEYQYLVRYTFPDGNYSNYEENLKCGDQLGHLDSYTYDKEGYPTAMTGLLGYTIREGAEADDALIEHYTERLTDIRTFVASRGPDNEALQEAFDFKVDGVFEEHALADFQEIKGLSVLEKLLSLFVSEAIRRSKPGEVKAPNKAILDLVVEYKYAYHEDLEAYIHNSADGVKQYKDKTSQNHMLLSELSTIYGENVKHVLRHEIFEKLSDEENYPKILDAYIRSIGEETEHELPAKQARRIESTFSNERIPEAKKYGVLYKQIWGIFSSNLKFKSKNEKEEFSEKLKTLASALEKELTIEKFRELLPQFFALRNAHRFDINAKLEELFSHDINQIFEELSKYEENIEEEKKEQRMGGPKEKEVKKSKKKRNIRGFFTKTAETTNARMGAYVCIAGDKKMWENENYLEFVMVDEDTNKCIGVTMLLDIEAEDGKRYLWFGPNPFESFLDQVSSQQCYDYMYNTVCGFAEDNGFDGVVVPSKDEQILGACTNRGGDFPGIIKTSRLRDDEDKLKIAKFGKKHKLGGGYGYEDGALIWEKAA